MLSFHWSVQYFVFVVPFIWQNGTFSNIFYNGCVKMASGMKEATVDVIYLILKNNAMFGAWEPCLHLSRWETKASLFLCRTRPVSTKLFKPCILAIYRGSLWQWREDIKPKTYPFKINIWRRCQRKNGSCITISYTYYNWNNYKSVTIKIMVKYNWANMDFKDTFTAMKMFPPPPRT